MSGLNYLIQIPGKTFFFGEYAALIGGESLLITTGPGFEIRFEQSQKATSNPFHPESPAGKLFKKHEGFFSNWQIQFVDHYLGRGGFGASTAQFLGLGLFKIYFENLDSSILSINRYENILSIWQDYLELNTNGPMPKSAMENWPQSPSGYDLWAQAFGTMVRVHRTVKEDVHFLVQPQSWPFQQNEFLLVPTGFKIPTHEHLKDLSTVSFENLKSLSEVLMKNFVENNHNEFFGGLKKWTNELESLGLVHPNTRDLLKSISVHPEVLFSKGCGALGADVILLIFAPNDRSFIKSMLQSMGLNESYGLSDVWKKEVRVL